MSEEKGSEAQAIDVLAGMFVILFGACITLAGGACTVGWIAVLFQSHSASEFTSALGFGAVMLLVGIGLVIGGSLLMRMGLRLARGFYRGVPENNEEFGVHEPPET